MTVSSLVPVNNYTGNGSTCQFDFDFLIEDEKELVVTLMNKKENTTEQLIFGVDYSINEIGSKNGSFIIYPLEEISSHEVLSPDEVLTLSLNLDIKQESEFENSATLKLDVLEWTFDYIVRVLQILSRKVDRSVKIVEGENTKPEELVKNLFDAEFNSKAYSKAAYQNLEEIKEMNTKINSDMKKLDKELKEVLHKTGDEEVGGIKNFTSEILYKGQNIFDYISNDYETAIKNKQDVLTAGENIAIVDNVISATGGFNLFDTKLSDHILEGDEAKGWALQGTYVYKEAVVGVRDGYPDFYNKVVEEYNNAVSTEMVNGITVKVNSNGHKFYNIADKTTIDELFDNTGLAWFYGVDEANERIFLPRDKYFALKGIAPVVGNGQAIMLSDGTLNAPLRQVNKDSYSYLQGYTGEQGSIGSSITGGTHLGFNERIGLSTDPTKSGIEAHLVPNEEKYLYICVGNTNVESAITDIVDVTTTENDTMPLFTGMYFDFKPNNLSWLKAGEQANSGDVYTTAYNELVNCLNGTNKYNLKVIDIADMVADVDYSEYWKVNQDEMSFVCPTVAGLFPNNRILVAKKEPTEDDTSWYNWYSDGWFEQGDQIITTSNPQTVQLLKSYTNADNYNLQLTCGDNDTNAKINGVAIYQKTSTGFTFVSGYNDAHYQVQINWRACGYAEIPNVSEYTENVSLYFKVANAVQNLELINVGEITESLADKISRQDCVAYITESYIDGTSGYNVYSNGYCEQWGYFKISGTVTLTLLKPYLNTDYQVLMASDYTNTLAEARVVNFNNKTTLSFQIINGSAATGCYWRTSGYIS